MYDPRVNFYLNDPEALGGRIIIQERGSDQGKNMGERLDKPKKGAENAYFSSGGSSR